METSTDLLHLATKYHDALPGRIRRYLNERGVPDLFIDSHLLGWNGRRITIPISDRQGRFAYFKLAKDPADESASPKMLNSRGAHAELYGWDSVLKNPQQIVICEGEFDRLVLEAHGFFAATSTAGAGVFRREWAEFFTLIPEVYVCFDNDAAGRDGAERVARLIPHARLVTLPEEVGPAGDVTDFFVRLGKSRADFERLMERALPALPEPPAPKPQARTVNGQPHGFPEGTVRERADRLKRDNPIAAIIGRYVKLQGANGRLVGLCPFHADRNPSFVVFPTTGSFHCFGCSKHGDVITFVREIEGWSFGEALDYLSRSAVGRKPVGSESGELQGNPESVSA